ncbi:MAG: HAD family hydrolase [Flavobacteriaceae bacterium]
MKPISHYQALIFDMDGTLLDNMQYHEKSWEVFLQENELSIDMKTFERDYHHGTLQEVMARLFPHLSKPEDLVAIGQRKEEVYRELCQPHLKALPGLHTFLNRIQNKKIPMGLATMGDQINIDFTLSGLELVNYFKATTGGDQVQQGKPHPEIFLSTSKKLGVDASHCLAFEDTRSGIQSALAAGMDVVGIATMFSERELLDLGCVGAVRNYLDFVVE